MRVLFMSCALSCVLLFSGCPQSDTDKTTANSAPVKQNATLERLPDGTCRHTAAYTCVEGEPCSAPPTTVVACPPTSLRYVRRGDGKCFLEPLMTCEVGTSCMTTLEPKACPAALTALGFILPEGDTCALTLVIDGERTTTQIPCPTDLVKASP